MPFDDLIRSGVAIADSMTGSLQAAIVHEAWIGQDAFGAPTYAAGISRDAIVERRAVLRQTVSGRLVSTFAKIAILRPVAANGTAGRTEPFDPRDRITLPDGAYGVIVDVVGLVDPDSNRPYFAELWIGEAHL